MSKELEITKEYGSNSWGLNGLTIEELRALYEAVRTADLPAARNIHDVKEILEETFSNLNNKDNGKRNI